MNDDQARAIVAFAIAVKAYTPPSHWAWRAPDSYETMQVANLVVETARSRLSRVNQSKVTKTIIAMCDTMGVPS